MAGDDELARDLAARAGELLLALRARGGGADQLRAAGDRLSHEFLTGELASARPGDAVLSEEGRDNPARLAADRVWIVDPLDGTREFGEDGRTDWAVHVALWQRGELTAGAVALPAKGRVLSTAEPPAPPAGQPAGGPLLVAVSRTRPPAFLDRLEVPGGLTLVPLGSAGAKTAAVISGQVGAYIHDGGQYEWDSAAPVAVARAAGLTATRLDGGKLAYNQSNPWLPDILICPVVHAGMLVDAIRVVRGSSEHHAAT